MKIIPFYAGFLLVGLSVILFNSCRQDRATPDYKSYPEEVGRIIINKCATAGCHNDVSREAAAGLSLTSWQRMFEGSVSGPVVIPYRPDFSTLLYFTNTYPELGVSMEPSMPLNGTPLSVAEIVTLRDWIKRGAPSLDGTVMFSGNPMRSKAYVTNQGCDVVTVFDAETAMPMRYITVGTVKGVNPPEAAHMVKVSPDGRHWYVIFSGVFPYLQKFRTSDDSLVGQVNLSPGSWNTMAITSDSKFAYCVDWSSVGSVAKVDLENMTSSLLINKQLPVPHGSALNPTDTMLYITKQSGNGVYIIPVNDPSLFEEISLDPVAPNTSFDAHEILFSPDGSEFFVTCQKTNEVRVFRSSDNALLKVIPVGVYPQEMSISTSTDYLFVTCTEDQQSFPGNRGSVAVIDYKKHELVKKIYTGHQPHGIAVDDSRNRVYVAHRNISADGPAPHHSSECAGRNGYVTFINLSNLEPEPRQVEIAVDPYSVAVRK